MAVSAAAWPAAATAAAAAGAYFAVPLKLRLVCTLERQVRQYLSECPRLQGAAGLGACRSAASQAQLPHGSQGCLVRSKLGAFPVVGSTAAAVVKPGAVPQRHVYKSMKCCRKPSCHRQLMQGASIRRALREGRLPCLRQGCGSRAAGRAAAAGPKPTAAAPLVIFNTAAGTAVALMPCFERQLSCSVQSSGGQTAAGVVCSGSERRRMETAQ